MGPDPAAAPPLPPHYWVLYQPSSKTISLRSDDSTAPATSQRRDGQCLIKAPEALADGEYALAFYPLPNDVKAAYVASQEAWIDLSTHQWVTPAPTADPRLETRKLLRLPLWTSGRKATIYGGGFNDSPPKASDHFQKTGLLKSDEIEAYGTTAAPWAIVLDHGWIKARVRYVFVNWNEGTEEIVPPGLVVEATGAGGKTIGKGTAIDDSRGEAYVLVSAASDAWKSVHFGFRVPPARALTCPARPRRPINGSRAWIPSPTSATR